MPHILRLLLRLVCLSPPHLTWGAVFLSSEAPPASAPVPAPALPPAPAAAQPAAPAPSHRQRPYALPELGFPYDALEGVFVGSRTMHLHHDRHHAFYVNTLNNAIAGSKVAAGRDIESLIQHIQELPTAVQGVVRNHGGGHMNHALFWKWLKPGGAQRPKGELKAKIDNDFGSFKKFQLAFEAAAIARFGSGWAWLVVEPGSQRFRVCSTANQDNPVMDVDIGDCRGTPVLGLDVWEHAYYLDYANARAKYAKSFWKVVNWDVVADRFAMALSAKSANVDERSAAGSAHVCLLIATLVFGVARQWI